MYLKGRADVWFHGFINSNPIANWSLFSTKVYKQFAESTAEKVIEIFSKIRQKGNVAEYRELFEDLKSQVMVSLPHFTKSYYISIFTSGLKKEIKSMVKIVRPNSVSQVFEIALL